MGEFLAVTPCNTLRGSKTPTETELSGGGDKTVHTRAETSVDVRPTADVGDDGGEPGGADSLTGEAMVAIVCCLFGVFARCVCFVSCCDVKQNLFDASGGYCPP